MSDLIGKLRGPKLMDMAIFDFVMTYVAAYFIQKKFMKKWSVNKLFILFILIGIFIHYKFEIPTMLGYYLGLNTREAVLERR